MLLFNKLASFRPASLGSSKKKNKEKYMMVTTFTKTH